ncbi:hypothetical protein LMG27952_06603 [Paraburkholderia hiiakae]|uniref:Uncharacterized protein n=1 Tax=Paraburkholderia hiiakae TaxID=1081782 RepID=A0ABN7IBH9_9BURK|nr:hypothetical protein LMG27952_06603 [Paraburkholderia hiiakae]
MTCWGRITHPEMPPARPAPVGICARRESVGVAVQWGLSCQPAFQSRQNGFSGVRPVRNLSLKSRPALLTAGISDKTPQKSHFETVTVRPLVPQLGVLKLRAPRNTSEFCAPTAQLLPHDTRRVFLGSFVRRHSRGARLMTPAPPLPRAPAIHCNAAKDARTRPACPRARSAPAPLRARRWPNGPPHADGRSRS